MAKRVITEADVAAAAEAGNTTMDAPFGQCIITPGARDKALALGVDLNEGEACPTGACPDRTPQAAEVVTQVASLIKQRLPKDLDPIKLENLVREVVTARMAGSPAPQKHNPDQALSQVGGVCFIKGNMIPGDLSGPISVEGKVKVADAFRCSEDSALAGGYMEWSGASFDRTVDNPEISIVIEGELHLTVDGQTAVMNQGDMVYLPKGTKVLYDAPNKVKLACVNSLK